MFNKLKNLDRLLIAPISVTQSIPEYIRKRDEY